ncbi:hypothetical protein JQC91_01855 [Jannaschia sp. Os4]|uniref:hypothetical protein n=1 Tax=Jannaschia sp. Os4 TaxID=2807617 RepID=UPI00193A32F2|nr:hypothetical protein [Jannaschia sp. Os4]MBM2575037.1 hypothetical protein [Jannaschia sp. Os4]
MRALFEEVTGAGRHLTTSVSRSVVIERDDIAQLCYKLGQWVESLNPEAASFSFEVEFLDSSGATEEISLSSLNEFLQHDFSGTSLVSEINIRFSFLVPNFRTGEHNNYDIRVVLNGFTLQPDGSNAVFGNPTYRERYGAAMRIYLSYIDYMVARNLQVVVKGWYEELEEYDIPQRPDWFPKLAEDNIYWGHGVYPVSAGSVFFLVVSWGILLLVANYQEGISRLFPELISLQGFIYILIAYQAMSLVIRMVRTYIEKRIYPIGSFQILAINNSTARMKDRHLALLNRKGRVARALFYTVSTGAIGSLIATAVLAIV